MNTRNPSADPRLYPMPGDVLVKGRSYREVTDLSPGGGGICYLYKRGGTAVRLCWITTWRAWAKDATVERRWEDSN